VPNPAASAAMRDSGNFVLYDYHNDSYVIWNSFDFPTDTISSGQNLSIMDRLVSSVSTSDKSSGRFYLDMQTDGNFVAYPVNSSGESDDSYWSSGTPNSGDSVQLILSHIGVLFLSGGGSDLSVHMVGILPLILVVGNISQYF
jgi:hypothetical protein